MPLYKDFKDRVRRNSIFSTRPPESIASSSFSSILRPQPTSPPQRTTPSRLSNATLPARPPRASLVVSSPILQDAPVTPPGIPWPGSSNSTSVAGASTQSLVVPGSHVSDTAWFIPVPLLDKANFPFEYQFGGTIGEGGFGKVLIALNLDTKQEHAIKVIAMRRLRSRRETASIANEIKVLRRVAQTPHPFLARPGRSRDWYWQYRGNVHLVMEYYQGGDLGRNAERHTELRNPHLFKIMVAEVVLGLLALHDMGIIHHDVKPGNIVIDGRGHCILTDFGGSCFMSSERKSDWLKDRTPIFTLRYAAPEVLNNGPAHRSYGPAIDFWSLGITLFELATGEEFIDDVDDNQVIHILQHGLVDMDQLVQLLPYPGLRPFVALLLVPQPAIRLQGPDIKHHEYFAGFQHSDWVAIERKERPPFRTNKQIGVNPRNTSYDYIDRPGESLLDDANEDIVNRWFMEEGVGMPHHKQSDYHQIHRKNARLGLPVNITTPPQPGEYRDQMALECRRL